MDIAYIGYSDVLLNHLLQSQDFNLIKVVYVEDRVSKKYKNLLEKNNLQNLKITSKDKLKMADNNEAGAQKGLRGTWE